MVHTFKILTGEGLIDQPTTCNGRKPCKRRSKTPAKRGWSLVEHAGHAGWEVRNGWWCPACVAKFKEMAAEHAGFFLQQRTLTTTEGGLA